MILTDLLALSHVPRWAIVPHRQPQNVGDHTFRVLVIFHELHERLEIRADYNDYLSVLHHDITESRSGDIPTPYKKDTGLGDFYDGPAYRSFSTIENERLFRLADLIEAHTFIFKHGTGPHAERVAIELKRKWVELAGQWYPTVNKMVDEILLEVGR